MVSQNSHASSEESLEKQKKRKAGCGCSNIVVSSSKRMIPFVRDFPRRCDPWERFATQCTQYSVQSESSSSGSFSYSSESEDLVVPLDALESVSSKEVEIKDVPQALDTTNPIHLLKASDHEAKELPEKVVYGSTPKGFKPHKRALAIRDYPIPPRRFQTPFSEDSLQSEVPDCNPRYDSEFEGLIVSFWESGLNESIKSAEEETPKDLDDIKQTDLEETSEYEAKEFSKEAELELSRSRYDLESGDSIISMYNISLNSFGLSEEEEEHEIDMPKVIDSKGLIDHSETSENEATDLKEEIASKGCDTWERFSTQCSQCSVQSASSSFSSFYYSSECEVLAVPLLEDALESVSSREVEIKDVPQAFHTTHPIYLLKTSDREAKELPEKVVSGFIPEGFKPRKKALAIRDYPIPPRRFRTPFSEDLVQSEVPDANPRYDSEFEDLMVFFPEKTPKALDDIKPIDLEETSEYEAKKLSKEFELEFSSSRYDLEYGDSIISMYNISLNSFGLSEEEEEEEGIDIAKVIDSMGLIDQSSNFMPPILPPNTIDSTTTDFPMAVSESGKVPTTAENEVPKDHKQIVIALLAAPNCHGRRRK